MGEVPSPETKGHRKESKQTGLAKFLPVYNTHLALFDLLYFCASARVSANPAEKYPGLTVSTSLLT